MSGYGQSKRELYEEITRLREQLAELRAAANDYLEWPSPGRHFRLAEAVKASKP